MISASTKLNVFCKDCGTLSPEGSAACAQCGSKNVEQIKDGEGDTKIFAAPTAAE